MTNRKILYGYQIVHGDLVIQEEERLTVQNVFTTYLAGLSYQALADRMNADNIPFSQESPLWNKHKIKRMLENPRYAGENGYPPIIDQDTFQQVQNKIAEKASGKLPRRMESDGLWAKLRSGCCQTRLLRTGGPIEHTGNVHLKCSACRNTFVVRKEELLAQTARQLAAHETPVCKPYAPSAEAVRLANAINRALEQPGDGKEALSHILQGAAARYACCDDGVDTAVSQMAVQQGGSIINISSVGGIVPDISQVAYGTSKAAINYLTKLIAVHEAKNKIRCNAVLPGMTATEAVEKHLTEEFRNLFLRHIPLGRMGLPEEIAAAVVYLASDEAAYTTGQILTVSGGFGLATPVYGDLATKKLRR